MLAACLTWLRLAKSSTRISQKLAFPFSSQELLPRNRFTSYNPMTITQGNWCGEKWT
jgi:hypothetical protein